MTRKAVLWSIGTGLVGSMIFSWMLEPTVTFVMTRASNWANGFMADFQNSVYTNAALGVRDWLTVVVFQLMSSAWIGLFIGMTSSLLLRQFVFKKEGPRANAIREAIYKRRSWLRVIILILALQPTYITSRLALLAYADLQLNASFNQRLAALAPALSEQEEEELIADWAMMTTRRDYDAINASMTALSQRLPDALPEPLY